MLISTFDTQKGQMQIGFLQASIPSPNTANDYKKSLFSFKVDQINPIHQMDLYKQTLDMLYSTLTNKVMPASKLQSSFINIKSQLKLENISSLAKDIKIKSLEDLAIKLGYNPKDLKVAE